MDTVSFVFQNSKLMKASILDNVRLSNPNASREEVMEALKSAQCMDIIEKMPDGVDTVIGAKGVYLSGGEQQRIAIARVMLKILQSLFWMRQLLLLTRTMKAGSKRHFPCYPKKNCDYDSTSFVYCGWSG